jgi:hypothetical protein
MILYLKQNINLNKNLIFLFVNILLLESDISLVKLAIPSDAKHFYLVKEYKFLSSILQRMHISR